MTLHKKSDVIKALQDFLAMVKTQYNTTVKEWMLDGGGEFKSDEFNDVLRQNGIKILQSIPYTPQQNGCAERFNQTIIEKAQALRFEACLPQSWWEFCVLHAVHLYNRTPIQCLNWRTPYELLQGVAPDVAHLRVLGCGAYVYLPEEHRPNKLSPRAEMMTFIGYQDGMKGYLFMQSNNSIFKATTALFDETLYPCCPESNTHGLTPLGKEPSHLGENSDIPSEADLEDDIDLFESPVQPPVSKRRSDPVRDDDQEQQDDQAQDQSVLDLPLAQSRPPSPPIDHGVQEEQLGNAPRHSL